MRFFFLILSLTTLLASTQPIWDLACKTLVGVCGVSVCGAGESTCTPLEEDSDENPIRQCCPSFQCCFLAFAGFSTPYVIDLPEFDLENVRPDERTAVLSSTFISECFHPPDFSFFT
ncbi:MAG: hypothetical protein AAFZ15_11325 [Bacteroidota bacterium]